MRLFKKKRDQLLEKDQELSEKEKKLSQLSSDSKKSENTLDDVDEFDEQIKLNFTDCAPISNIENDPATSKNSFNSHYEPIRPMIEFPISFEGATNRKIVFKSSWYDMYAWLEYSKSKDRAYCFCCRMFDNDPSRKISFSVNSTLLSKLKTHSLSTSHIFSNDKWKSRIETERTNQSVASSIDKQHAIEIKSNRNNLKIILECILFCAKQGLPFRGHFEGEESKNKGNFLELIDFKARYLSNFKQFIEQSTFNYISPKIQNELIEILALQLIKKLMPGSFYSIIIDETMDLGRIEQIAFVMRFVDNQFEIHEYEK